jgi:gamma-glutamylcyclotransferase (GGCT)/AIG2-like uncharacterized protein YtfP
MAERLFVYGTLLPGHAPPSMAGLRCKLKSVAPATVRGRLYDLGAYPAVVMEGESACVRGELVEVDSDATWRALDEYEGCPRPGEGNGLFRRVRTIATLDSGESADCWVYVYDRDLGDAKVIDSGCWRTHRGLM